MYWLVRRSTVLLLSTSNIIVPLCLWCNFGSVELGFQGLVVKAKSKDRTKDRQVRQEHTPCKLTSGNGLKVYKTEMLCKNIES